MKRDHAASVGKIASFLGLDPAPEQWPTVLECTSFKWMKANEDKFELRSVTEVPILEWVLLYNDYDPEGDPIDLVNVANVTNLTTVTHSAPGNPGVGPFGWLFMHDSTFPLVNTGSFTYQATDGTPGNVATVTVLQTGNPVNGTSADEILIGANGAGDVLNGFGGNDILVGSGLGTDTLNGGEGDDVYVFTFIDLNLGPGVRLQL